MEENVIMMDEERKKQILTILAQKYPEEFEPLLEEETVNS